MKRTLAVLLALVACAGCGSVRKQYARSAIVYTAAARSVVDAHVAGLLQDADVLRIAPYNAAAHAALGQMHQALVAGRDDAFTIHLRAFQAALDALTTELEEHKVWTPSSD
jgi:hypothetical protein